MTGEDGLMDKQLYVDRILESENLTDELQDPDARWLLDWGISQLDAVLQKASSEEDAGEKVTAWMGALRKINRMLGARDGKSQEALAADCMALASFYAQAFGLETTASQARCDAAAAQLSQGTTRQALKFLTAWVHQ
jgi:hypothetical protein